MAVDQDQLLQLEGLLLRGQKFMDRYYPSYLPRESNNMEHWNLYLDSQKHEKLYATWYARVVDILEFGIADPYYTTRIKRAKPSSKITVLAPDRMYHSVEELVRIVGELRKIHNAERNIHLLDDAEQATAHFDYKEPNLLLVVGEGESYVVHAFRKGKPKSVLEYALKQTNGTALKSHFRTGGMAGMAIKENFPNIFRSFNSEKFPDIPFNRAFTITSSSFKFERLSFVITRKQLRQIAKNYKKSK